jgi:hypothetical protein
MERLHERCLQASAGWCNIHEADAPELELEEVVRRNLRQQLMDAVRARMGQQDWSASEIASPGRIVPVLTTEA